MQRGPITSILVAFAIVLSGAATAAALAPTAAVAPPAASLAGGADADGVPERWILGQETIAAMDLALAERIRVLPGALLTIEGSTLTFAAHPGGPTGLVAEPGSEVRILGSTLQGQGFLVHLEGHTNISGARITGADAVVLQPRPTTDHVDALLGASLERQVLGWRVARTLTQPTALLAGSTIQGPGPALVAAVPTQYDASQPEPTAPAVALRDSAVRATAGAALVCQATTVQPDPDFGLPIPLLAAGEVTTLAIEGTILESAQGPVLHCPTAPQARAMPARNLPLLPPDLVGAINAAIPAPPQAQAAPGPALVRMVGGALLGRGVGALLDGPLRFEADGVHLGGLGPAVLLDHPLAVADLREPTGSDLALGIEVRAGTLALAGGDLAGPGIGLRVIGGSATITGATLRGFALGLDALAPMSFTGGILEGMALCARLAAPATLGASTLQSCGTGVLLDMATGAVVQGNAFQGNADPLRVASPNQALAHYQHTVAANTVHGRALAYVVGASNQHRDDPIGHLVVAHSTNVAFHDLDLTHGQWHAAASQGIVLGATTANTPALLARTDPGAAPMVERVGPGVRYESSMGSLRGPQGTLDEGTGSDLDQARALVHLLRGAGREARFVDGTFRITTPAYLNWVHMEHPGFAFGMPGFRGQWFGSFAVMERTWVELKVAPGVWVELDPAFEQYTHTAPVDAAALAGLDLMAPFNEGGDELALVDQGTHSIARIDWETALDRFEANSDAVAAFARAQGLTDRDLLGGSVPRVPTAAEEPTQRRATARSDEVPVDRMWSVRIRTAQAGVDPRFEVDWWGTTTDAYGKRLVLESTPSDVAEANELTSLGGLYQAARSRIEMTTYLYVGDQPAAADGAIPQPDGSFLLPDNAAQRTVHRKPGDLLDLVIEVRAPGNQTFQVKHSPLRVGGSYAVALEIGRVSPPLLQRLADQLEQDLDVLGHGVGVEVANHRLTGALTHFHGLSYFGQVRGVTDVLARKMEVVPGPTVGVAVTGNSLNPHAYFNASQGRWVEATYTTPPYIDVQGSEFATPMDGNRSRSAHYTLMATMHGSNLEDKVFAGLYATPSVSTVKILNVANAQGQRIYHLNSSYAHEVLPHIQGLPSTVYNSIVQAVNEGKDVITTGQQVTYLNWTGVGWIEYDTQTGASGFLIYGGTAPPTNGASVTPMLLNGGSGAQFILFSDDPAARFDLGYLYGDETWFDWTVTGYGAILDWGGSSTYQDFMDASKLYRGKALNNAQRSLAGVLDTPAAKAKFFGRASIVLTVGLDAIEIAEVWTKPEGTTRDRIITTAGLVAVDAAELAVGGWAIAQGAGLGAAVGGAIGDGPGVVIGAVVGGLGAAFATGTVFSGIKSFLFG